MSVQELKQTVISALEDMKAVEPVVLDVHGKTAITDWMVIASGNSNRHVRSIADGLVEEVKKTGMRPLGVEGQDGGEWVLVDLGDVIVHVMQPQVRELYRLERIWGVDESEDDYLSGNA